MKNILAGFLFLAALCCSFVLQAQITPAIEWQKCLGGSANDFFYSIHQTTDEGYIISGRSASNNGDVSGNHGEDDYWIVKLDMTGNLIWQKSMGGSDDEDGYSIQQTADSGFIIVGISSSDDGDVTGHHDCFDYYGCPDYWVVKLDADGNLVWQKSLGGSDNDYGYSIQQTTDGGYIVGGGSGSEDGDVLVNYGGTDYWIVKLDTAGNIEWQKTYGGSDRDEVFSIQQTADGGYIAAGSTESNDGDVTGNHGQSDYWIIRLDTVGNLVWQKSFGGSSTETQRYMQQTKDGGFIIVGTTFSDDGDVTGYHYLGDYWVVKLDSTGNLEWQKILGGYNQEFGISACQTTDGNFVIGGWSQSNNGDVSGNHGITDYWMVKLDTGGNLVWQKTFGGTLTDVGAYLEQTADNGFIFGGYSYSNNDDVSGNHGNSDYWIMKLTPDVLTIFYADTDSDGFGNLNDTITALLPPPGYVADYTDCNDSSAAIHPGALEVCNAIDDNCNGLIDDGLVFIVSYLDGDGDGYGNIAVKDSSCDGIPAGYVANSLDCNDGDAAINPGASEVCNSADDNCNGSVDEGLVFLSYYQDYDGDGFGNVFVSDSACDGSPAGYVTDSTDCNDNDANVYPGTTEIQNGIDDNCNGITDEFPTAIHNTNSPMNFLLYPNPVQSQLTINLATPANQVTIRVYDMQGRMIPLPISNFSRSTAGQTSNSIQLNTEKLPDGLYMLQISDKNSGRLEYAKFVKAD